MNQEHAARRLGKGAVPAPAAPLPAALAAYATGEPEPAYRLLAEREDGTVVRCGQVVAKAHAADSDPEELAVRMRIAADRALAGVLLPPLRPVAGLLRGRPVSLWPYGDPVDAERPEDAPWEAAAELLAALHRVPLAALPGPLPAMRGPAKLARALGRLARAGGPDRGPRPDADSAPAPGGSRGGSGLGPQAVWDAARTLPAWARGEAPAPGGGVLCHGDLHLGQLVRGSAAGGGWRLIDVDDLGVGAPAWDLARPAAWFAAGVLGSSAWGRFLEAYRAAGGPAAGPPGCDPWPALDTAARALTVQTAALALAKAAENRRRLDDVERLMVESCARIGTLPPDLAGTRPA
ncbi:aminoglycoside phosphotransferase family protein [Streptomyces globosus]|uniref:Aminoglycoside phosphotransferase family protein n=1 Tax=Streptomyces globosus TaxID=68209 RepID=A0A344U400_9ACTN|nr:MULTISPECIES: phosphotransferase [Streptomyces]AXE25621.1 aminoglycoside phosphotransferase family protein [Streptomyces globosus]